MILHASQLIESGVEPELSEEVELSADEKVHRCHCPHLIVCVDRDIITFNRL